MHLACIKTGYVAGFPHADLLAGNKVGVFDLLTAQIGFLEVPLYPFWRGVGAPRLNPVFADFAVPHVRKGVLIEAAFIFPRLED